MANHRTTQENLLAQAQQEAYLSANSPMETLLGHRPVSPIKTSEIVFAEDTQIDGRCRAEQLEVDPRTNT